MVICLERGADLHTAQLMPLPLTASCFSKTQIGFTFLVPAHLGSPGQRAIKRVCVCVLYLANPDHDSDFQSLMNYGHDPYCIHKQRVDTTDCRTFPPMWFVKISRPVFICVVKMVQLLNWHYLSLQCGVLIVECGHWSLLLTTLTFNCNVLTHKPLFQDKDGKFRLILVESRIHRLARYYKAKKVLPPVWK